MARETQTNFFPHLRIYIFHYFYFLPENSLVFPYNFDFHSLRLEYLSLPCRTRSVNIIFSVLLIHFFIYISNWIFYSFLESFSLFFFCVSVFRGEIWSVYKSARVTHENSFFVCQQIFWLDSFSFAFMKIMLEWESEILFGFYDQIERKFMYRVNIYSRTTLDFYSYSVSNYGSKHQIAIFFWNSNKFLSWILIFLNNTIGVSQYDLSFNFHHLHSRVCYDCQCLSFGKTENDPFSRFVPSFTHSAWQFECEGFHRIIFHLFCSFCSIIIRIEMENYYY